MRHTNKSKFKLWISSLIRNLWFDVVSGLEFKTLKFKYHHILNYKIHEKKIVNDMHSQFKILYINNHHLVYDR